MKSPREYPLGGGRTTGVAHRYGLRSTIEGQGDAGQSADPAGRVALGRDSDGTVGSGSGFGVSRYTDPDTVIHGQNEVLNDESTVVSQIQIEALPGSSVDLLSDNGITKTLSADLGKPNQPNEQASANLIVLADQVELKDGSKEVVKFLMNFKTGSFTTSSSTTELMPADAENLSDVLKVHITSGEYNYGETRKLLSFMGISYSISVKRPK
jgi:hypothetical protein